MDPETILLTEEEAGERLDKLLFKRFKGHFSRSYFQHLIEQHLVLVNGEGVKKRTKPVAGDEIEVAFLYTPEIHLTPEPIPLNILYEDDDLLALNKPAGMVVHPAPGHWKGTLAHALLHHCRLELPGHESLRPGIVHRLDKDTSGVMVVAKTMEAHARLVQAFSERRVSKEYIAICVGTPPQGKVDAPIGRHRLRRQEMAVVENGKKAVSVVEPLYSNGSLSVVKVYPETGRTHQIRVHLQYLGHPILGDSLYGNSRINEKDKVNRQLLHASRLCLTHPINGKSLEIKADPPEDMLSWMKKISK